MKTRCRIKMTRELAFACGQDAANQNMRKNGRKSWNREDYDMAWQKFDQLWPIGNDCPDEQLAGVESQEVLCCENQ